MVWQPDVWAKALRSTRQTSYRMCRTKEECELVCKQQLGWRPWAYDLGRAPKASNHPKAFVAAPDDTFLAAYALVPPEHRHAYEVVAGPCDMFLDLELEGEQWQRGSELAEAVEEAACAVVADMACPTPPQRCRLSCVEAGPAAWSCGPTHAYQGVGPSAVDG